MTGKPHRWVKGMKSPNPAGRSPRVVEQAYLDVLLGACDLPAWQRICEVAVEDATEGNASTRRYARDWLSRIILPALERILIASYTANVSMNVSASSEQVQELMSLLLGGSMDALVQGDDTGDVIEGQVLDSMGDDV